MSPDFRDILSEYTWKSGGGLRARIHPLE